MPWTRQWAMRRGTKPAPGAPRWLQLAAVGGGEIQASAQRGGGTRAATHALGAARLPGGACPLTCTRCCFIFWLSCFMRAPALMRFSLSRLQEPGVVVVLCVSVLWGGGGGGGGRGACGLGWVGTLSTFLRCGKELLCTPPHGGPGTPTCRLRNHRPALPRRPPAPCQAPQRVRT